jgi:hypothetical protein
MASVAVGMGAAAMASASAWFIPMLVGSMMKYRYDIHNPEGRVIDTMYPEDEYDFIVGELLSIVNRLEIFLRDSLPIGFIASQAIV